MRRCIVLISFLVGGAAFGAEPSNEAKLILKPEAFPTLVNPNCSHCRDEAERRAGELRAGDRVLCWLRGYSDGGAIPYRFFLNPYRVISDSYGVFVYDPDAGYARGFAPSYDFRFHGWRNGVMVMKHKDGTVYSCLTGLAFDGPRKGTRLHAIPTLVSDWADWLKQYPHAVAYHMFDKYKPVELPAKVNEDSRKSRLRPDPRLSADAAVVGVWDGKQARAYPIDELAKDGFIQEAVDGQPRVVFWYAATRSAAAYLPEASPPRKYSAPRPDKNGESPIAKEPTDGRRKLTLVRDDKDKSAPFTDKETGSRWDIAGRAVSGELKGWTLTWLDSTQVKWFAWAAEYPETTTYGK
ncbi:MAG TPA: DUF3179 domain-containing (seleno)protein [Gemmataceae bacterium]|nr:DUF3179 domain-containing (seleno)protein [Gemmataceae bacterium]